MKKIKPHPLKETHKELPSLQGVGKETADSILLYALEYPAFVVDAYTQKLFERLPVNIKV